MDHRRSQWLEKVHVQVVTVGALLAVYLLLAPHLRGWDPQASPVAFLAEGAWARLAVFAAAVWLLAALMAVMTVGVRPEGALLATLIGAGGVSLGSPRIQALLWRRTGHWGGMYLQLAAEMLVLLVVLVGVVAIIATVRRLIGRVRPGWLWRDPLAGARDHGAADVKGPAPAGAPAGLLAALAGLHRSAGEQPACLRAALGRAAVCGALGTALSAAAVLVLLRSPLRGQVLFAVFAGTTLAYFVAHQAFPSKLRIAAWGGPILLAVAFYALAAWASAGLGPEPGPQTWTRLPLYGRPLPVDWLTAGCGGALLGTWFSARLHEMRHHEKQQTEQE